MQIIALIIILRIKEVMARTGLSRSSIYSFCKNGTFPAPVKLGTRAVGWKQNEIDDWINSRSTSEDKK